MCTTIDAWPDGFGIGAEQDNRLSPQVDLGQVPAHYLPSPFAQDGHGIQDAIPRLAEQVQVAVA